MADIEKVIKGLDCRGNDIRVPYEKFPCDCSYFVKKDEKHSYSYCDLHKVLNDAIALLKEQEAWINEIAEYQQSISGSGMHELDDYEKGKWDGLQIAWNIISEGR